MERTDSGQIGEEGAMGNTMIRKIAAFGDR
jgi:hypothetical protein